MLKLAVSTLTFDGFGDNDFVNTFANVQKVGYQRIEFNCWHPRTLTPVKMQDVKRRCEKAGVIPVSLHVNAFGGGNNDALTTNVCHKIRAIEAAVELGCRRVVASGMDIQEKETGGIEAVIQQLKILAPIAEKADVLLCLENHCNNVLAGEEDYKRVFQEIHSSHVGICVDTGHFDAAGVEMTAFIEKFSDKVNHIHLKENKEFGVKRFCRFGEGTTDNEKVVKQLLEKGYSGYMSVELSPEIGESGDSIAFGL